MAISSEALPVPFPPLEPPAPPDAEPSAGRVPGAAPDAFQRLLSALGRRIDQGEVAVDRALGRDLGGLDARELVAVQAGIYRYAESVELASRLVDRADNAVRTVLTSGGH